MIADNTEISRIITEIENKYSASPPISQQWAILYSKLAVIEFCGWIEQTFDAILENYISNKIVLPKNVDFIKNSIIKRNYGLHYDNNFRNLIRNIIGMNRLENFEDYLENTNGSLTIFRTKLEMYTRERNNAAHTYSPNGTTITYQSPSAVLSEINTLTPILQTIETEIMKY
jgi:hypothetical protein